MNSDILNELFILLENGDYDSALVLFGEWLPSVSDYNKARRLYELLHARISMRDEAYIHLLDSIYFGYSSKTWEQEVLSGGHLHYLKLREDAHAEPGKVIEALKYMEGMIPLATYALKGALYKYLEKDLANFRDCDSVIEVIVNNMVEIVNSLDEDITFE